MKKDVDNSIGRLWRAFGAKKSSIDEFRIAYNHFSETAVMDSVLFEEWYDYLEQQKGAEGLNVGWKQIYMRAFDLIGLFLENLSIQEEQKVIANTTNQLLKMNTQLEAETEENRLLLLTILTDIVTAFGEDDQKLAYAALIYYVMQAAESDRLIKRFYGDGGREVIIEETVFSVFSIQSYGCYDFNSPAETVTDVMSREASEEYVTFFCSKLLTVGDKDLKKVMKSRYSASAQKEDRDVEAFKGLVGGISNSSFSVKNKGMLIGGIGVVVLVIIAFSIGRLTSGGGSAKASLTAKESEVASLQSELAAASSENESMKAELEAAETESETVGALIGSVTGETNADGTPVTAETNADGTPVSAETNADGTPVSAETNADGTPVTSTTGTTGAVAGSYWTIPSMINFRESKQLSDDNIIEVINSGESVYVVTGKDSEGWIEITYDDNTGYVNFDN